MTFWNRPSGYLFNCITVLIALKAVLIDWSLGLCSVVRVALPHDCGLILCTCLYDTIGTVTAGKPQ
jgi:hypothetical protein